MKIRIIAKPNRDGEVLWEDLGKVFTPVEIICPIDGKALELFQKDWIQFIARLHSSSPSIPEFKDKLLKKSISLEQIVFGNRELPWKKSDFKGDIFFQTDPEFTAYPWEILTTQNAFFFERENFYRGIRATTNPMEKGYANHFLLIENPVLDNLKDSVNKEGKKIAGIFEDLDSIPLKRLKSEQFKLTRFWDEISSAAYLHYAGHTEKGGIPIPNENILLNEEIGRSKLSNLKIVFLNSCHSAYEGENISGLATQFLKSGASFVLGFLSPIETQIAEKIGIEFWQNYIKSRNPRQAFLKVKSQLQSGTVNEFASSLAFVCFSPEEKKKSKNILLTIILCAFLLSGLFFMSWFRNKNSHPSGQIESSEKKENVSILKTQKDNPDSLKNKIAKIQNPKFRNKIYEFLKEENPLLDDIEKKHIVEEVLGTNGTEEVKFYHFKQLTGSQ